MDLQQLELLQEAERKFDKACQQIIILDHQINDLETLYKRSVKSKKNAFRYNLRLKLSVITGVKMMYHHYAGTQAEEINRIRRSLRSYFVTDMENDDSDPDMAAADNQIDESNNSPSTSNSSGNAQAELVDDSSNNEAEHMDSSSDANSDDL